MTFWLLKKISTVSLLIIGLQACQTTSGGVDYNKEIKSAKIIPLTTKDSHELLGVWKDTYNTDTGYSGQGVMTLTPAGGASVRGVFEYFSAVGDERFPEKGTISGVVKPDGKLYFGPWGLTLIERDGKFTLTTRQKAFGTTVNFYWTRDDLNLDR